MWCEVIAITFSCVMFIHMELVDAIIGVLKVQNKRMPIITCPKCLTFWSVLCFLAFTRHNIIHSIAIAFFASYTAIWLDLLLGLMDMLYENIYNRISEPNDTEVHNQNDRQ